MENVVRAKWPARLPTVLPRSEVQSVLARMDGVYGLMARLLYGTGMRLMECVRLRAIVSASSTPKNIVMT
jgi:integrase